MSVLSFWRRWLFALGVALLLSSIALPAWAQTIAVVNEQSLPRLNNKGESIGKRAVNLKPEGVSFQDCVDDQRIRFTLQLAGFAGEASLQAWASLSGVDCKTQTNRSGGTQQCWRLIEGNIPLQTVVDVDIPVRMLMAGVTSAQNLKTDASVCGTVDLTTISVQFLYFARGQNATPATDKTLSIEVDTVGPSAPTGLKVFPGNGRISVEWTNISGEGGVSVLTGVRVYCDTVAGGGDASTTADAGQDCVEVPNDAGEDVDADFDAGSSLVCTPREAGSGGGDCASANFVNSDGSKKIPDAEFNSRFECGSFFGQSGSGAQATSVGGQPLQNGTRYVVAVAATDAYNNVGALSDPVCETPALTTDFWEDYKNAGGGAGGGYCTTSGVGLPVGSISVCAIIALAALSSVRRTWRKRR